MKIWTSEHTFNHPWETVAQAMWRKYPNPHNQAVVAIDVLDRTVKEDGTLQSDRLISSNWHLPDWAKRIVGAADFCYAREHSTVDPTKKEITMYTTNLTFCNILSVDERLSYSVDPTDSTKTHMKQEAVIAVRGVPLSSYMESFLANTISSNARKGRLAMEWVIGKINTEVSDLKASASTLCQSIDDVAHEIQILATPKVSAASPETKT